MAKTHKYIITGATGKIGTELLRILKRGSYIVFTRSPEKLNKSIKKFVVDLSKAKIKGKFEDYDVVIHLAAETHIERCEADKVEKKKSMAWMNNVVATQNISEFCKNNHKKLVMLSTESVFGNGKTKYSEKDKPNPKSWYGITKFESEKVVNKNVSDFAILRTVMAYGGKGRAMDLPRLIINRLKNKKAINLSTDQRIAFTYTGDIVRALLNISEKDIVGLYHFCGPSILSPFELGLLIAKKYHLDKNLLIPKSMKELHGVKGARLRLTNAVLSNDKFIKDVGCSNFTNIKQGLDLL